MPPESWEARGPAEAIIGGLYGLQAQLPLASPQRIELRTVVFGAQLAALEHWGLFGLSGWPCHSGYSTN